MKKFVYYILIILCFSSCEEFVQENTSDAEGALVLALSVDSSTKSITGDDVTLEDCTLRIYNEDDGLLRKYVASETPESIYLVKGNYYAEITANEKAEYSYDKSKLYYYGKTEFTIEAGYTSQTNIVCKVQNSLINIAFDESVTSTFDTSFSCKINAGDLTFSEDGEFYYYDVNNEGSIAWSFEGMSSNQLIGELGYMSNSGNITINPSSEYTLKFSYSKTPDGILDLQLSISEYDEVIYDGLAFSPQPTISGSGFSISETMAVTSTSSYTFDVASPNDLDNLTITSNGYTFTPLIGGVAQSASGGVSYTVTDARAGKLTLSNDFFNTYTTGGVYSLTFDITDKGGEQTIEDAKLAINGILDPTNVDLWLNTISFSAIYNESTPTQAYIHYKEAKDIDWTIVPVTKDSDHLYSVSLAPEWEQSLNSRGLYVNQMKEGTGFFAGESYEYKLVFDGTDVYSNSYSADPGHTIDDANMESSSLDCYSEVTDNSQTWWASGNNSMAEGLCTRSTKTGQGDSYCALLSGKSATWVGLAAGNLFLGTFYRATASGTASFGQPFTWVSRPKTFKFKYAAQVGIIDNAYHSGASLSEGDRDISRIMLCIVDWSSRQAVEAGTSSPTGVWSPDSASSYSQGNIIGYAIFDTQESDSGDMQEKEITINYYDTETKPSGNYTIVISCATSLYGDYMVGCTTGKLWVDDFAFGY